MTKSGKSHFQLLLDMRLVLVELVERYFDTLLARLLGLVATDNDELECRWSSAKFEFTFETHPLAIVKGY